LLLVATQFAILVMAKLDAGSSYGEYGGGGSDGSFGGASSSTEGAGYGGGLSRQQPYSVCVCVCLCAAFFGSTLCSLAACRLSDDKDKLCLPEAMRPSTP